MNLFDLNNKLTKIIQGFLNLQSDLSDLKTKDFFLLKKRDTEKHKKTLLQIIAHNAQIKNLKALLNK